MDYGRPGAGSENIGVCSYHQSAGLRYGKVNGVTVSGSWALAYRPEDFLQAVADSASCRGEHRNDLGFNRELKVKTDEFWKAWPRANQKATKNFWPLPGKESHVRRSG